MHTVFELWVRKTFGNRYDLTRDVDGFYCREIVKRMFEVWCHCRGLNVVRGELWGWIAYLYQPTAATREKRLMPLTNGYKEEYGKKGYMY